MSVASFLWTPNERQPHVWTFQIGADVVSQMGGACYLGNQRNRGGVCPGRVCLSRAAWHETGDGKRTGDTSLSDNSGEWGYMSSRYCCHRNKSHAQHQRCGDVFFWDSPVLCQRFSARGKKQALSLSWLIGRSGSKSLIFKLQVRSLKSQHPGPKISP